MASEDRLRELEEKYEGYTVYDNSGSKIGKVDDLFVDEKDSEEYIGVKMGFFGTKSTLIPMEVVRVNENDRTIEVSESKDHVKDAPSFSDDDDVTGEYEERIRSHFGLESLQGGTGRGSYGGSSTGAATGTAAAGAAGTTDRDEDHETGTSGYASGDSDHDAGHETSSTGETREDDYSGGRGSSGETYADDRETSSSAGGTEHDERREDSGGTSAAGQTGGSSSSGYSGDQEGYQGSGSSGTTESSQQGSSGAQPATSKQTEETETFQEGGRTKIRRRIVREEIVDADDEGSRS